MADAPLAKGENFQEEFTDNSPINAVRSSLSKNQWSNSGIINCNRSEAIMTQKPIENVNEIARCLDNCSSLESTLADNQIKAVNPKSLPVGEPSVNAEYRLRELGSKADANSEGKLINDPRIFNNLPYSNNTEMPIDGNNEYMQQLQKQGLHTIRAQGVYSNETGLVEGADDSDDEEFQQVLDLNSLTFSTSTEGLDEEEPVLTADQVISEIEEMMQESMIAESKRETIDGPSKTAQLIQVRLGHSIPTGSSIKDCLESMSLRDLRDLNEDLDRTINDYSDVLVEQLALREELSFRKELNNQFISLLLSIQKKRRDQEVERRKSSAPKPPPQPLSKTETISSTFIIAKKFLSSDKLAASTAPSVTYLTTVIPYNPHEGIPDADRLQIYIKIMTAIDNDNPTVPVLLTDYILKGLGTAPAD